MKKNYINSTQYGDLSFNFNTLINNDVSDELKFLLMISLKDLIELLILNMEEVLNPFITFISL